MMQVAARGVASSSRASTSAASTYPCCRKVFVDMPNAFSRSNNQCREKSIAASLPSDSTRPSRGQKKISKHERRAIVESYVDKYRATNAGKFPTVSHTRKETGGSHYTVREIIQELKYKSKFPHVKQAEEFRPGKIKEEMYTSSNAKKEPCLTKPEEVSVSVSSESCTYHEQSLEHPASFSEGIINGFITDDNPENVTETQGSPITCSHVEKTCDESSVYSNQTKGSPGVPSYDTKNFTAEVVKPVPQNDSVKWLEGLENSGNPLSCVDSDHDSSGGTGLQDSSAARVAVSSLKDSDNDLSDIMGSIGSHNSGVKSDARDNMPKSFPEKPDSSRGDVDDQKGIEEKDGQELSRTGDHRKLEQEVSPEESTVWQNLKSLARGIISFWKKT